MKPRPALFTSATLRARSHGEAGERRGQPGRLLVAPFLRESRVAGHVHEADRRSRSHPLQHACSFEEAIKPETLGDLARLLSEYFRTLVQGFGDPGYEMVLHTAPNLRSRILQGDWATIRDDYHWHIEIIPEPEHANRVGGIFVNETRPEASAAELRQAWAKVAERS